MISVSLRPVNYDRLRKRQGHQRHNRHQNNDHLLTPIFGKTPTFTSATPFSGYVGEATKQLKTKFDELNIKL